jgi:hypothetical protein
MDKHIQAATALTELLENKFHIFGLRFGLDPVVGLIPWLGDFITMFLSFYLVWIGLQMKLPGEKINKMISNIVIDFLMGSIPFIGDIGDVFYRSNSRNLIILKSHVPSSIADGEIVS